jgi:energy-coupling factor transport system substrate-specific component
MSSIKKEFSLIAVLLIPVCVAINIVGFQLCQLLRLPVFLDSIGTITAGAIAGPWVGMATGAVTNAVNGVFNPVYFAYTPTSVLIGLVAGLLGGCGMFAKWWKTAISGVIIMAVATVCSGFITAIVFSGATGSTGSVITATLMAAGNNIFTAVFSVQAFQEIADKLISVLVFALQVRAMPVRYLSKLKYGHLYVAQRSAPTSLPTVRESGNEPAA